MTMSVHTERLLQASGDIRSSVAQSDLQPHLRTPRVGDLQAWRHLSAFTTAAEAFAAASAEQLAVIANAIALGADDAGRADQLQFVARWGRPERHASDAAHRRLRGSGPRRHHVGIPPPCARASVGPRRCARSPGSVGETPRWRRLARRRCRRPELEWPTLAQGDHGCVGLHRRHRAVRRCDRGRPAHHSHVGPGRIGVRRAARSVRAGGRRTLRQVRGGGVVRDGCRGLVRHLDDRSDRGDPRPVEGAQPSSRERARCRNDRDRTGERGRRHRCRHGRGGGAPGPAGRAEPAGS